MQFHPLPNLRRRAARKALREQVSGGQAVLRPAERRVGVQGPLSFQALFYGQQAGQSVRVPDHVLVLPGAERERRVPSVRQRVLRHL